MKLILFLFLAVFLNQSLSPKIIVRQTKNGRIILTNCPSSTMKGRTVSFRAIKNRRATAPSKYREKINLLAASSGLRRDLIIAVARAESGFNPYAISHKGAVGLMQLMPDTARLYGVKNRFDWESNLTAGVRHLKYLYLKYRKNLPLTLAAYNAGEKAVSKYAGVPPYKETRQYIRKVMRFMGLRYGGLLSPRPAQKLYKVIKPDGRILITDSIPHGKSTKVELIK